MLNSLRVVSEAKEVLDRGTRHANRQGTRTLKEVIYHCDGPTLFRHYDIDFYNDDPGLPVADLGFHDLLKKHAVEHIMESLQAGNIFMVTLGGEGSHGGGPSPVWALEDLMGAPQLADRDIASLAQLSHCVSDDESELDFSGGARVAMAPREDLHQRVLRLHPTITKYAYFSVALASLPPPAAYIAHRPSSSTASVLPKKAMAVMQHHVLHVSRETRQLMLSSEPGPTMGHNDIFVPAALTWEELQSVRTWAETPEVFFLPRNTSTPPDKVPVLAATLRTMIDTGAVVDAREFWVEDDEPCLDVLQTLRREGIVQMTSQHGARSAWQITHGGLDQLVTCKSLRGAPKQMLALPDDIDVRDYSTVQLMIHLHQEGWRHERAKSKRHAPPAYEHPDGDKVWVTIKAAKTAHRPYLLALALASRHGIAVPHCEPDGLYEALLEGRDFAPQGRARRLVFLQDGASAAMVQGAKRRRVVAAALLDADDGAGEALLDADDGAGDAPTSNESGDSSSESGPHPLRRVWRPL